MIKLAIHRTRKPAPSFHLIASITAGTVTAKYFILYTIANTMPV